jgi:hypothetical protein
MVKTINRTVNKESSRRFFVLHERSNKLYKFVRNKFQCDFAITNLYKCCVLRIKITPDRNMCPPQAFSSQWKFIEPKKKSTSQNPREARGSVVVKALCCKPEGRGLSPDELDFLN